MILFRWYAAGLLWCSNHPKQGAFLLASLLILGLFILWFGKASGALPQEVGCS